MANLSTRPPLARRKLDALMAVAAPSIIFALLRAWTMSAEWLAAGLTVLFAILMHIAYERTAAAECEASRRQAFNAAITTLETAGVVPPAPEHAAQELQQRQLG